MLNYHKYKQPSQHNILKISNYTIDPGYEELVANKRYVSR